MKRYYLTISLLIGCLYTHSQNARKASIEQIFSLGSYIATGLPAGIDGDASFSLQSGFIVSIPLNPKYKLEAGLTYHWTKNSLDGHFLKENDAVVFKTTPDDYKQHSLQMDRINVPVKVKRIFDEQVALGISLTASYYTSAVSKYKISNTKYEVKGVPFRRFQLSPGFDLDIKIPLSKSYFIIGGGVAYQITSFTPGRSFKPLLLELRFQNPLFF
jgi:hypothetical protein